VNFLLDTHLLLWVSVAPQRLSRSAHELLSDERNSLTFSAASIWEIALKNALRRPHFSINTRDLRSQLLENGYRELDVTSHHAVNIDALPLLHKDPFDRLLIAQATAEGLTLLTVDDAVAQYPGPIRRV